MTDDELDALEDAMEEQGEALREALAEDLGGDPDDYRKRPLSDGTWYCGSCGAYLAEVWELPGWRRDDD